MRAHDYHAGVRHAPGAAGFNTAGDLTAAAASHITMPGLSGTVSDTAPCR